MANSTVGHYWTIIVDGSAQVFSDLVVLPVAVCKFLLCYWQMLIAALALAAVGTLASPVAAIVLWSSAAGMVFAVITHIVTPFFLGAFTSENEISPEARVGNFGLWVYASVHRAVVMVVAYIMLWAISSEGAAFAPYLIARL